MRIIDECKHFTAKNPGRLYHIIGCLFLVCGCLLRIYAPLSVPAGLNQDEAATGYEAFLLAFYGVNKMGHPWPVYPSTFGSGGGSPLMIYLNVLATRLFGPSPAILRLICSVAGCFTLVLFSLFVARFVSEVHRKASAPAAFCIASAVLALIPWHIILSRWSKEPNMVPFWEILATVLLLIALQSGKTAHFVLAATFHALCLYAYGAANIVIPLHLLLTLPYSLYHKRIRPLQLLWSGIAFVVVLIPLIAYYAVNYLGFPELITPYFSLEKLTFNRLNTVFIFSSDNAGTRLVRNIGILIKNLTIGFEDGDITSYMPGYATMYRYTFPITLWGMILAARSLIRKHVGEKRFSFLILPCSLFAASALYSLTIEQTISRDIFLYLPLTFFLVYGTLWLFMNRKKVFFATACVFLIGSALFIRDYFRHYNDLDMVPLRFYNGLTEAIAHAGELNVDGTIYITKLNINSPDMMALYAVRPDPDTFSSTVVYDERELEFVTIKAFDRYVMGIPEEIGDHGTGENTFLSDAFVVHNYETHLFEGSRREQITFGDYTLILPAVQ